MAENPQAGYSKRLIFVRQKSRQKNITWVLAFPPQNEIEKGKMKKAWTSIEYAAGNFKIQRHTLFAL